MGQRACPVGLVSQRQPQGPPSALDAFREPHPTPQALHVGGLRKWSEAPSSMYCFKVLHLRLSPVDAPRSHTFALQASLVLLVLPPATALSASSVQLA